MKVPAPIDELVPIPTKLLKVQGELKVLAALKV